MGYLKTYDQNASCGVNRVAVVQVSNFDTITDGGQGQEGISFNQPVIVKTDAGTYWARDPGTNQIQGGCEDQGKASSFTFEVVKYWVGSASHECTVFCHDNNKYCRVGADGYTLEATSDTPQNFTLTWA
jgi:hypothetical protein